MLEDHRFSGSVLFIIFLGFAGDYMDKVVVVIGGGAAGMAAASKAKRTNPSLRVIVLEAKGFVSHAPCGTPFYIGGYFDDPNLLVHYPVEVFTKKRKIEIMLRTKAQKIDFDGNIVYAIGQDGEGLELSYDYLVLAMGAKPRRLNVDGEDLENIFHIRHMEDALPIREKLPEIENVVLIGAGFINVEMAEAFIRQKKKVTMITRGTRVLSRLDPDMSEIVEKELISKSIDLRKEEHVLAFEGDNRVKKVITDKGEYDADLVIVGIGVEPYTDIIRNSPIKLGYKGAIRVNPRMQTNIDRVYAVGDVAEMTHVVTGRPTWYPLAQIANKMGRVAGSNIGGVPMEFNGVAGTSLLRFFDLSIGITGLNSREAEREGYRVKTVRIEASDKPHYYPTARKIWLKLIYDEETRKLLGGQAIGGETIAGRINVVATALHAGLSIDDLYNIDLGYSPPFAPVWDPIVIASSVAMRDLAKKSKHRN